jgi:hypothetical protein
MPKSLRTFGLLNITMVLFYDLNKQQLLLLPGKLHQGDMRSRNRCRLKAGKCSAGLRTIVETGIKKRKIRNLGMKNDE